MQAAPRIYVSQIRRLLNPPSAFKKENLFIPSFSNCNHQISAITNVLVVFFWKMPRTFSYCSHDGGKQNYVEKMNAAFCWKYLALINKLLSLV